MLWKFQICKIGRFWRSVSGDDSTCLLPLTFTLKLVKMVNLISFQRNAFSAMPHGPWAFSSLTKYQTPALCSENQSPSRRATGEGLVGIPGVAPGPPAVERSRASRFSSGGLSQRPVLRTPHLHLEGCGIHRGWGGRGETFESQGTLRLSQAGRSVPGEGPHSVQGKTPGPTGQIEQGQGPGPHICVG